MHVQFLSVEAKNFRSFEEFSLTLDPFGITLVQGKIEGGSETLESNGAGKSSIFSAISWALFGKFPHVSGSKVSGDKVVRRGSGGDCHVTVKLQIARDNLEITRFRLHSLHGDKLTLKVNGKDETQSSNQRTQQIIESFLGISFELFVNLIFVTEATIKESFAFETDANRKKMLVSALPQFQRFGKARLKVKDSLSQFTGFTKKLLVEREAFEVALQEVQQSPLPDVAQINARVNFLKEEIAALELSVKSREAEINDVNAQLSELDSSTLDLQIVESRESKNLAQSVLNKLNLQHETAKEQFDAWEQMGSACPICEQSISYSEKLGHIQRFKDEVHNLVLHEEVARLQLEDAKKKLKEFEGRKQRIQDTRNRAQALKELAQRKIAADASSLEAKSAEIKQLGEIAKNLSEVARLREEKRKSIQSRLDELDTMLIIVRNFENSLNVWVEGFGPRGVVSLALNQIVEILTQKTELWLQRLWHEGTTLVFNFVGDDLSKIESKLFVNQSSVDLESLSSGETRRLCLALCFGLRESLQELTGWKSNLLILDEVFDGLDGVGRTKVLSELGALPETSVFVISQFPQLSEEISRVIQVRFANNLSTLEILLEN